MYIYREIRALYIPPLTCAAKTSIACFVSSLEDKCRVDPGQRNAWLLVAVTCVTKSLDVFGLSHYANSPLLLFTPLLIIYPTIISDTLSPTTGTFTRRFQHVPRTAATFRVNPCYCVCIGLDALILFSSVHICMQVVSIR